MNYYGRPIVLQKPPSPLHYLFGGMGQGITQSLQRYLEEKKRKRDIANQVLENVLMGNIPPAALATDVGQRYLESLGISEEPQLKGLIETGRREYTIPEGTMEMPSGGLVNIPGVVPPEIPFETYVEREKEKTITKEEAAWKRALRRKLEEWNLKDQFESEAARQRALDGIIQAEADAKRRDTEIQDMDVNYKTGEVKVNYLEPFEKKEIETKMEKTKFGGKTYDQYKADYNLKVTNAHTARRNAIKFLSSIGTGMEDPLWETMIKEMLKDKGIDFEKTKDMAPEERKRLLIGEYNKEIDAWNKELKDMATKLNLKSNEVVKIKQIGPGLEEMEPPEPKEPLGESDIRNITAAPIKTEKKLSDEDHVELANYLKSLGINKYNMKGERATKIFEKAKELGYDVEKIKSLLD